MNLYILMVTIMPGVITIGPDSTPAFQKYIIHRVNNARNNKKTSPPLKDVPELPDHIDVDLDDWSHPPPFPDSNHNPPSTIPTSQASPLRVGHLVNMSWSLTEKVGHSQNIHLHHEIAFEDWLVTHQIIRYTILLTFPCGCKSTCKS